MRSNGSPKFVSVEGFLKPLEGATSPIDTIAISGQHTRETLHSSAYLATSGEYGVLAGDFRPHTCPGYCDPVAEFRAAHYALKAVGAEKPILILSNNEEAVDWMNRWKDGESKLPGAYMLDRMGQKRPSLDRLRDAIASRALDVSLQYVDVSDHSLLTYGASTMAGIGLNDLSGVYQKQTNGEGLGVRRRIQHAATFLHDHQRALSE